MNVESIFLLQFALSAVAWALVVWCLVNPWLARLPRHEALLWLIAPHAFRHVGLVFLVPGVVDQPLPEVFAVPAAYGDLAAGLLAALAMVALKARWAMAIPVVWLFSITGTVDLVKALGHIEVVPSFGATWYIPTFLVPLLLLTHLMVLARLLRGRDRAQQGRSLPS